MMGSWVPGTLARSRWALQLAGLDPESPDALTRFHELMEQLTITELLGGLRASIGCEQLDSLNPWPRGTIYKCEDDYISDGSPGLANFMTCLLEPLEAQGRGFVHGHKKVTGVPRLSAANIKRIFTQEDDQVSSFMTQMRAAVLQAASTLQYESAVLPAKQMDVVVLPTNFLSTNRALVAWMVVLKLTKKPCDLF